MKLYVWTIGLMFLGLSHAWGYEEKEASATYDQENAEDINELCAGCHGANGQGGGKGIYPRLAGLPADYMAKQIVDFKTRKRVNIPMLPYANDRELAPEDVRDITIYLSEIELASRMPEQTEKMDGLARLRQAESIVQIGRHPGNAMNGSSLYMQYCRYCHAKDGMGRANTPTIVGQHIVYLKKQLEDFRSKEREHDDWKNIMTKMNDEDMRDILAFLSILDD